MNKIVRSNLRVKLGDVVSVHDCMDIMYGERVHILPMDDTIEGVTGNLYDAYLKREFLTGFMCVFYYIICFYACLLVFNRDHHLGFRFIPILS